MAAPEEAAAGGQAQKQLAIQRIYVKDISFEAPNAPNVFNREWRPEVSMNLGTASRGVGPNLHEVTLTATVTVKSGEETAFLV